jgi:hypothetical protein
MTPYTVTSQLDVLAVSPTLWRPLEDLAVVVVALAVVDVAAAEVDVEPPDADFLVLLPQATVRSDNRATIKAPRVNALI